MNWLHVAEMTVALLIVVSLAKLYDYIECRLGDIRKIRYRAAIDKLNRMRSKSLDLRYNPLDTEEDVNIPAKQFVPTTGFLECKACGKSKAQVDEEITKLKFCYPTALGAGRVDFHDWAWVEDVVTTPTRTVEPLNDFERALNG